MKTIPPHFNCEFDISAYLLSCAVSVDLLYYNMRRKHFTTAHVNVSLQNQLGETEKVPVETGVKACDGSSSYGLSSY